MYFFPVRAKDFLSFVDTRFWITTGRKTIKFDLFLLSSTSTLSPKKSLKTFLAFVWRWKTFYLFVRWKFCCYFTLVSLLLRCLMYIRMKGRKLICSNRLYFVRCKWMNSMAGCYTLMIKSKFLFLSFALFILAQNIRQELKQFCNNRVEIRRCLLLEKQERFGIASRIFDEFSLSLQLLVVQEILLHHK